MLYEVAYYSDFIYINVYSSYTQEGYFAGTVLYSVPALKSISDSGGMWLSVVGPDWLFVGYPMKRIAE